MSNNSPLGIPIALASIAALRTIALNSRCDNPTALYFAASAFSCVWMAFMVVVVSY